DRIAVQDPYQLVDGKDASAGRELDKEPGHDSVADSGDRFVRGAIPEDLDGIRLDEFDGVCGTKGHRGVGGKDGINQRFRRGRSSCLCLGQLAVGCAVRSSINPQSVGRSQLDSAKLIDSISKASVELPP